MSLSEFNTKPPEQVGGGWEPEQWISKFLLERRINPEEEHKALDILAPRKAGFVNPSDDKERAFIVVRVEGFMDEAIYDAAQAIKPVLGSIATLQVAQVVIISHSDIAKSPAEGAAFRGYDVTQTVLNYLEEPHD